MPEIEETDEELRHADLMEVLEELTEAIRKNKAEPVNVTVEPSRVSVLETPHKPVSYEFTIERNKAQLITKVIARPY